MKSLSNDAMWSAGRKNKVKTTNAQIPANLLVTGRGSRNANTLAVCHLQPPDAGTNTEHRDWACMVIVTDELHAGQPE